MSFLYGLLGDPNFLGALLGALITGLVAIGVYKGNLRNIEESEKEKIKSNNYKEFKILESVISDVSTSTKIILEKSKQNELKSTELFTFSTSIIDLEKHVNFINPKNFTTEKEIFLWAQSLISDYWFLNNRCKQILKNSPIVFNSQKEKEDFIEFLQVYLDEMSTSYDAIRNGFIEIKYKV